VAEHSAELQDRVEQAASRLRAVQADLADAEEDLREEHLLDELQRSLEGLMPAEREVFLEELGKRFPSWDQAVAPIDREDRAPGRSGVDERELDDPSFLVERLLAIAPRMSEGERATAGRRLASVGLAPAGGEISEQSLAFVREMMPGDASGEVDPARCAELAAVLLDFTLKVDKVVWMTWRQMARSATIRRKGGLEAKSMAFASGDPSVSRNEVVEEVELLRRVLAGILAVLPQSGRLCYQRMSFLFPESVMDAAHMEGKKGERAYWKKFTELAGDFGQAAFEAEVIRGLAENVEQRVAIR